MKKCFSIGTLLTLTGLFLFGCTDTTENPGNILGSDVRIIASHNLILPPSQARSIIGDTQADGSLVMNWDVQDELGVFTTTGNNLRFVNENTSPMPEASFKPAPGVSLQDEPQVGYYPYDAKNTDRMSIPAVIPQSQDYEDVSSIAHYDFKAATAMKQPDGSFLLQMKQMTTLIRFVINAQELKNEIEKVGANSHLDQIDVSTQHIQSIDISTDDEVRLTGSYTYDLTNLDAGLKLVDSKETKGSLTVNLKSLPALSSVEDLSFYAIVAPGNHRNQTLTCKVSCENVALTFSAKIVCDFESGKYYMLTLNSATIAKAIQESIKVDVLPDTPSGPIYPDASEETANCYMIHTVGEHTFWCTQIGNGDKGIIPDVGFHVTSSKINPKSAKLMWQDVENFIDASSIRIENGKVHYTANKNAGNAMIAVYSGENCTGDILWSWHIWGVGDTMPVDEEFTNQAGAKFMVMNRTLGTHSADSYNATLYQWGRKDPFPNTSVYYLTDGSQVDISTSYPMYKPQANDVTILTSVQRCDQIIDCFDWNIGPNWLNNDNQYLWGDTNIKDHYSWWGSGLSNPEAGAGWTNQKTIYDPSPVGYRVPNKFTFSGFVNYSDGEADITGTLNEGKIEEVLNVITQPRPGQEPGHYIFWWPKFNHGYYFK